MINGDLATILGSEHSQIVTGPFWPGWPFLLLLIPVTSPTSNVHATLAQRFVKPFPVRLIGDNAYESDRLFLAMLHLACCLILLRGL